MKLTGHKTEAVYRRYAIVSEADFREASPSWKLSTGTVTRTLARRRRRWAGW
jgi:hypothetical protein